MKKLLLGTAMGAVGFLGASLSAHAGPCVTAPVATYTAAGFSCNVDGVTFSNLSLTVNTGSIGSSPTISPLILGNENSLEVNYSAGGGTTTDFTFQFTVTAALGSLLTDAFASLTGLPPASLSESLLGNGNPSLGSVGNISLILPGTSTQTISITPPQFSLLAVKDQLTGANGEASALINGFSVSAVPGPIVGAGLPGLIAACGGLIGLARRRRLRTA
jgi:hypothetical protein